MPRFHRAAVATLVLVPVVAGGFLLQERSTRDGARLFDQVLSIVSDRFVDTLDTAALYEKAARGLVHELNDPYTELMSPKQYTRFTTNTGGRYGGIGMQIEDQQGNITVSRVFPHTPAEEAGVQEGDRIIQIDTVLTRGWKLSQVSETLIGEPGTKVAVKFQRPGVAEPIAVKFTRATIHIPAVQYSMILDGKIGYIPLQQFNETAASELDASLRQLLKAGARGIVLDLRDNPGGILDQALSVSNLFLRSGQEIASVRGRASDPQSYVAKGTSAAPTMPLIVLTNGYSASASEIVAGALQDHDRALIVGTTSFGKGLVQTLFPLEGGYALKMTTAKWYTPSGRSIQKERKVVDGKFVEPIALRAGAETPDSLETDSVKKHRPAYRSDAGRVVYGGGGITPDVIVPDDTVTTAEQQLAKAIAPKSPVVYSVLYNFALELKSRINNRPDFTVDPTWREEFYRRLTTAGVELDKKQYDAAGNYVDRLIEYRVARLAFGDSAAKRREVPYDAPLRKAIELLNKGGGSQKDLFVLAAAATPAERKPQASPSEAAVNRTPPH